MVKSLIISPATKNNWKRLHLSEDEIEEKLISRANKIQSEKKFIPKEYFIHKKNIPLFTEILKQIDKYDYDIENIIYNLSLNLLCEKNFIEIDNNNILTDYSNIKLILSEFNNVKLIKEIINLPLKMFEEEDDILGLFYQSLSKEGNKNLKGSYYTPKNIVNHLLSEMTEKSDFMDPCCGTGRFILQAANIIKNPQNIYGIDTDRIACLIAKINLIIKYKNKKFIPNIYNIDFLENSSEIINKKFDLIATNPPWGAKLSKKYANKYKDILSKESSSYFIVQAKRFLKKTGTANFVLPESILTVSTHCDIRNYILENFSIKEIKLWGKCFKNVFSDVITIKLNETNNDENNILIIKNNKTNYIKQSAYCHNVDKKFMLINETDNNLIKYIYSVPHETLKNSLWGLGIVTGNNSKHITVKKTNSEKIYSGKDILPYFVNDTNNYIVYKRELFQQTAPDEIYRADEKLVYKFISDKLIFAYDDKKRLFINSANILIPNVKTHSIKTVLAILNSSVFQYLYKTNFGGIKVLKTDLLRFPFPIIDNETKINLEKLADKYMQEKNNNYLNEINSIVYKLFKLDENQIKYLEAALV